MSIEAQLQIRQNAQEIQSYLKDLFAWEEDVKAKEKKLKLKKKQDGQEGTPGPRGRAAGNISAPPAELQKPGLDPKTCKSNAPAPPVKPSGPSAAGGIQLPTQVARESEDLGLTAVSSTRLQADSKAASSSSSQEPQLPPVRNTATGPLLLARGNDHFKLGDYKSAEECYSRSIELEPCSLPHANRAMALLKLGRHAEAEADCSEAIRMDSKYVKAWLRRGAARRALGMVLEAGEALLLLLSCVRQWRQMHAAARCCGSPSVHAWMQLWKVWRCRALRMAGRGVWHPTSMGHGQVHALQH